MTYYWKDGTRAPRYPDPGWDEIQAALMDPTQQRVAETTLPDGKWISTVWLGLDHGLRGRPLIFETMVFAFRDGPDGRLGKELDCDRYSTEEEAKQGHADMVEKWSSFNCPRCQRVSHNPNDLRERYCGACKAFFPPETDGVS